MDTVHVITFSHILGRKEPLGTKRLFEHLDAQLRPKNRQFAIKLLAQIAIRLHKRLTEKGMSLYEADGELLVIPGYSQGPVLQEILELKKRDARFVLFNQQAFKLIYHLLLHDIDFTDDAQALDDFPPILPYDEFSPVGIFLIANEILNDLKNGRHPTAEESIDIRDFYSRCLVDPAGAVGRSGLFYDRPYFNRELQARIGVSVQDARSIAFDHLTHILTKDPAVFDPKASFKVPEQNRPALEAISALLTARYKSQKIKFSELVKQLDIDLSLEKKIRRKPLLEVDGLSYCLCPELLGTPLADLPYHLIWGDMLSKREDTGNLKSERGSAFHEYIASFTELVLGKDICHRAYLKKDGEFGDLLIDLAPEEKLMIEWKVAEPLDSAKAGNIKEIIKRFLLPSLGKGRGREQPGPLQVMDAAIDYRKKMGFKGVIYTAVGYYGWFPEVPLFDVIYGQQIKTAQTCIEYEKMQENIPTILWNAFTWELMLSAIKQSASPTKPAVAVLCEMLAVLRPHVDQPSQSASLIEGYFKKNGLKFSVAPIFSDEIHKLARESQSRLAAV